MPSTARSSIGRVKAVGLVVGVLWLVFGVFALVPGLHVEAFCLVPRTIHGLIGIFAAPFLHANYRHLLMNTIGIVPLAVFASRRGGDAVLFVMAFTALAGGAMTWLVGRHACHLGASGVLCGLFGFVVVDAWRTRNLLAGLLAFAAIWLFGGAVLSGLVPAAGISWEGHATGVLAGGLAARRFPRR